MQMDCVVLKEHNVLGTTVWGVELLCDISHRWNDFNI